MARSWLHGTGYEQARAATPARWSGGTRDWWRVAAVTLNPERDAVVAGAVDGVEKRLRAA